MTSRNQQAEGPEARLFDDIAGLERREAAARLRDCLIYLEREALRNDLSLLAHLIGTAALSAGEMAEASD